LLAGAILLYLAASIAVGLYAATRVRGAADFAVATNRFGTPVVMATVFATWFGAETVLGIPSTFWKEGLRGLVADPFAAMGCLVLVGAVFARPFHRLGVLTLGDYFRDRFDTQRDVFHLGHKLLATARRCRRSQRSKGLEHRRLRMYEPFRPQRCEGSPTHALSEAFLCAARWVNEVLHRIPR